MNWPLAVIGSTIVEILESDATSESAAKGVRWHDLDMVSRCDGTRILGTRTDRNTIVPATAPVMSSDDVCCDEETIGHACESN
jgi:hypothetical protein